MNTQASKRVQTPRGFFKIAFNTLEEAEKEGFFLWFTHNGYNIVANGTSAFAVENA